MLKVVGDHVHFLILSKTLLANNEHTFTYLKFLAVKKQIALLTSQLAKERNGISMTVDCVLRREWCKVTAPCSPVAATSKLNIPLSCVTLNHFLFNSWTRDTYFLNNSRRNSSGPGSDAPWNSKNQLLISLLFFLNVKRNTIYTQKYVFSRRVARPWVKEGGEQRRRRRLREAIQTRTESVGQNRSRCSV